MSDDFSGIFDNLDPNDFSAPIEKIETTAVEQKSNPAGNWTGGAFDLFVAECTEQLAIAFSTSGGNPVPYAVLSSPRLERTFLTIENGAETWKQFYQRLHGEAQIMNAHWMFTFFKLPVGVVEVKVDLPDGADIGDVDIEVTEEMMEHAKEIAKNSVAWLAESVEPGYQAKRRGLFRIKGLHLEGEEITHVAGHPNPSDLIFHPEPKRG